jgi:hypothetical protein
MLRRDKSRSVPRVLHNYQHQWHFFHWSFGEFYLYRGQSLCGILGDQWFVRFQRVDLVLLPRRSNQHHGSDTNLIRNERYHGTGICWYILLFNVNRNLSNLSRQFDVDGWQQCPSQRLGSDELPGGNLQSTRLFLEEFSLSHFVHQGLDSCGKTS